MKIEKKYFPKTVVCLVAVVFLAMAGFCFGSVDFSRAETSAPDFVEVVDSDSGVCSGASFWNNPLDCSLVVVLKFMGFLLSLSATLFGWIILPDNMMAVISNPVIYSTWAMIRDTLNIGFILVLLFSAFATIFQVSSYNYKKILLNVVLMALLVNFSYPISRFIIDLSNSMMYYFVNALGVGNAESLNPFVQIAEKSGVARIISASNGNSDTTYLLAAIIFVFILAVTLLVIAVLFVIRTVALALLIIFSSVAFIGSTIPAFSGKAGAWWDYLFKYAFFGPIMVFLLYVSLRMMTYIGTAGMGSMQKIAGSQAGDSNFIAAMAFFSIPIIILWFGLGMAQSMSIAGAGMVTGKGKNFINWAGKNWGGIRPIGSWGAKKTGIPGGAKAGWDNFKKTGMAFGKKLPLYGGTDAVERNESKFGGFFKDGSSGWTDAEIELGRKKVNEMRKGWKDQGATDSKAMHDKLKKGNSIERRAAALEIAENHSFDNFKDYKVGLEAVGDKDKVLKKIFDDKIKDKHIQYVIDKELEDGKISDKEKVQDIYDKYLGKLNNDKFAGQINLDPSNPHVEEYIKEVYVKNPSDHQNIFSKLKGSKKKEWLKQGLAPVNDKNKTNKNQDSKRAYEDIQRERAEKAQDEINDTFKDV